LNILEGSIRSGKTYVSLIVFALWVAMQPLDKQFLMAARTLTSLRRNCLDLLQTLVGDGSFMYSIASKEATLFGHKIYLEGCNDSRSEMKIRGMTLKGAYCDELTLFTEDFFTMLLTRLSEPDAKLFATTNPDVPTHWLRESYLDRAAVLDLLTMRFVIDDNPYLSPQFIENIKKEFTGAFYSRFVLGEWIRAEGVIYSMFDKKVHTFNYNFRPTTDHYEYLISVDYGTSNPTAALLWCIYDGVGYCLREYYHDGRKDGQLTDEEHVDNIKCRLYDIIPPEFVNDAVTVIIDPSAASLRTCIHRITPKLFTPYHANNSVLDGIRYTASALLNKRILFHESCVNVIREFQLYSWDDKRKDEAPLQVDDHAMDAVRYFVRTYLFRVLGGVFV